MSDWIHFIGRKYYPTPEAFASESERLGITRRVSREAIKTVSFGDVVHCAMINNRGNAEIFGSFAVTRLSGLSRAEMIKLIIEQADSVELPEPDDSEPELTERGCGEYIAADPIVADMSIAEIIEAIDGVPDGDKGKLMLGGVFVPHEIVGTLRDVEHRQGIRRFDYRSFAIARDNLVRNALTPDVAGKFYAGPGEPGQARGEIQAVTKYRRSEQIERDDREAIKQRDASRQGNFDFGNLNGQ